MVFVRRHSMSGYLLIAVLCGIGIGRLMNNSTVEASGNAFLKDSRDMESRMAALEELTQFMRLEFEGRGLGTGPNVFFEGVNVHIRSGSGSTTDGGTLTGLGNLIIGYNEAGGVDDQHRGGSHNLIVGSSHQYESFGGIVTGFNNAIHGSWSNVLGGFNNTASGNGASVAGGQGNNSSGALTWVGGGRFNNATGFWSSVSGGQSNFATGRSASVAGGVRNDAIGDWSMVTGGRDNFAMGNSSSVGGGLFNGAVGGGSTVSGGLQRTAPGNQDWVAGIAIRRLLKRFQL